MDRTALFYSQPTYARGGGLPVYSGSRRQRGGGVLGAIKSFFMPLLSSFGRKGARAAMNVAKNVVGDVVSGKSIASSLKGHGLKAAKRFGSEVISDTIGHVSKGLGSTRRSAPKRKAKSSRKRAASRKSKPRTKRSRPNF